MQRELSSSLLYSIAPIPRWGIKGISLLRRTTANWRQRRTMRGRVLATHLKDRTAMMQTRYLAKSERRWTS